MEKTLLITDDATIIREVIKTAAREAGWRVIGEATNGLEAVESYKTLKPDLVTLDLVMPEYDGMYALRGILQADPNAKVMVVSAVEQKAILKEAFRLGAVDFVVKPFNKKALVETLQKAALNVSAAPAPVSAAS